MWLTMSTINCSPWSAALINSCFTYLTMSTIKPSLICCLIAAYRCYSCCSCLKVLSNKCRQFWSQHCRPVWVYVLVPANSHCLVSDQLGNMCVNTLTVNRFKCCRLTGPARFRLGIFARHGNLVVIPHNRINAEWVKSELEAATQSSLHEAFVSSAKGPGTASKTLAAPSHICVLTPFRTTECCSINNDP